MLAVLSHPSLTVSHYTTVLISYFNNSLHFFKSPPANTEGIIILSGYYLAYILAFIFCYACLRLWQRSGSLQVKSYQTVDIIIVSIIGVLIGAKLNYVLFYNLEFYISHPLQIITNWSGMSSHGAIIGVCVGIFLYARKTKLSYFHIMDHAAICASFVPVFIRLANFFNGELFGRQASSALPWAMRFFLRDGWGRSLFIDAQDHIYRLMMFTTQGKPLSHPYLQLITDPFSKGHESFEVIKHIYPNLISRLYVGADSGQIIQAAALITDPRHPSQFYQLIASGIVLFGALLWLKRYIHIKGQVMAAGMMGYGLTRMAMEFFREQDFQRSTGIFEYISMGQFLSIAMMLIGASLFYYLHATVKK